MNWQQQRATWQPPRSAGVPPRAPLAPGGRSRSRACRSSSGVHATSADVKEVHGVVQEVGSHVCAVGRKRDARDGVVRKARVAHLGRAEQQRLQAGQQSASGPQVTIDAMCVRVSAKLPHTGAISPYRSKASAPLWMTSCSGRDHFRFLDNNKIQ